jgi:adenylylsulfate kinase-like enzyme
VRSTTKLNGQVVTVSTIVQYTADKIENQATLGNGTFVEVEGTTPSGPDLIIATRIKLR